MGGTHISTHPHPYTRTPVTATGWAAMALLLVLGLLHIVPYVAGGESVSVLSILKASKEAIESYDVEKNMEIVHKHYFTTTKEQSIWYYAMKVTKETFGMDLGLENLEFTERIIQKMATHVNSCSKQSSVIRADCYSRIGDTLLDLEHALRWTFEETAGADSTRPKWGILYNSAAYLAAHVSVIAIKGMTEGYKDKQWILKSKVKTLMEALHKHSIMAIWSGESWAASIKQWRKDQIGPATICDMKEYLWQSFQQSCETRWYSSEWVLTGPNDEFTGVKRSELNTTTGEKKSDLTDSDDIDISDFDQLTGVEPEALNLLTKFGGVDNLKVKRYRVQIFDNVPKKFVYEKFMNAEPSSRGITLDKLAIGALKARTEAVNNEVGKIGDLVGTLDAFKEVNLVRDFIQKQL